MKKILIILAVILALALPIAAFGLTSDSQPAKNIRSFCGICVDASKLTELQKADLSESFNKMIELRKETINKMVENGSITKEQGALELKRIDDMVKYHNENGSSFGSDMMGYGVSGSRMMNGNGRNGSIKNGMMNRFNN